MNLLTTTEAHVHDRTYHAALCHCGKVAVAADGMVAWMPSAQLALAFATDVLLWSKRWGCRICQKPVVASIPWRVAEPRVQAALEADPEVTLCGFVESVAWELAQAGGLTDTDRASDRDEEPFRMEAV